MPLLELIRLGDVFMIAFLAAALSAYPVYRLLLLTKSRQTVSEYLPEHQGKQGTPTMGGLIILVGALAGLLAHVFMDMDYWSPGKSETSPALGAVSGSTDFLSAAFLCLVGFALIGFADDFIVPRFGKGKRGLGWKQKILPQIVFAGLASGSLVRWNFGIEFWLSVFLILSFANAYNFSDGLDGLAGSLLLTLGLGLAALATHSGALIEVKVAIAALMGAVIPFLFLNAPPARIFMGDVGSLPIGACLGLAVSAMLFRPAIGWRAADEVGGWSNSYLLVVPLLILSLVMIAELVPVPLQILSVKLRGKRLFPRTPIHHAFEAKGWPETRIVWTFALFQLVLAGAALYTYLRLVEAASGTSGSHQYGIFTTELGALR